MTFAGNTPSRMVLAVTPKNPETDYGLFVRPFTQHSWMAIGGTILLSVVCISFPFLAMPNVEDTTGHQVS